MKSPVIFLIIDADGVEMICTETTRAITINNCRNLTLSSLPLNTGGWKPEAVSTW
jgi:hypothetical protein